MRDHTYLFCRHGHYTNMKIFKESIGVLHRGDFFVSGHSTPLHILKKIVRLDYQNV